MADQCTVRAGPTGKSAYLHLFNDRGTNIDTTDVSSNLLPQKLLVQDRMVDQHVCRGCVLRSTFGNLPYAM